MSEHHRAPQHHGPEHARPPSGVESHAETPERRRHSEASPERPQDGQAERLAHAKRQVEQLAISGAEQAPPADRHTDMPPAVRIGSHLKAQNLRRTLGRLQGRLSAPERAVSRIVHQPLVERASDIGSQTIARPSGLLGGGTVAFIGSLIFYLAAKRYGYAYNFSVVLMLFIGGFFLGMTIELAIYRYRTQKTR